MSRVQKFSGVLRAATVARKAGKKIVSTNGCFDIVHIGHVRNLAVAKRLGDVLVVGINSDASVRRYKGAKRPIIPARERAELIAALKSVDHTFVFNEDDPTAWVKKLRPDVHVKGRGAPHYVEKSSVEHGGGTHVLLPLTKGRSTSTIIETVLKRYRQE